MTELDNLPPDLDDPSLYVNKWVSWMRFNERVLELVSDRRHPLLERLRLLCITATNLDEFIEVRIPKMERLRQKGVASIGREAVAPADLLDQLDALTAEFVDRQYETFDAIRGELADEKIHLVRPDEWTDTERDWTDRLFEYEVSPVLSHTPVHPDHPFPRVLNKAMNFLVGVRRGSGSDGEDIVRVPESLPKVLRFPPGSADGVYRFCLLSDIVAEHIDRLFPDGEVDAQAAFRVTRDSNIGIEAGAADDLRMALEDELLARPYGPPIRLEVPSETDPAAVERLREQFDVSPARIFRLDGPVDLARLRAIGEMVDRPDLEYAPFTPGRPAGAREKNIYEGIEDDGGFVLHHPYESFDPFIEFIERAASDPKVEAIKQTVYRTSEDSPVTDALVRAARAGKEVTAVVELRARFDEQQNVRLADRLRDAGATVVYGPPDYKVHTKMALVVRRKGKTRYRYAHVGTGNYHPQTARFYTDLGYFTADRRVTADVATIFEAIEQNELPPELDVMLAAPTTLHDGIIQRIEREIAHAHLGKKKTGIRAKLNRLTDPEIIEALYRASRAGVEIDLIVRGMCALKPGIEGVSENIRVRSIVGRFLEHSRAYFFENKGKSEVWIASADWRTKNTRRRIEQAAPIREKDISKWLAREVFDTYLADNTHAWELQSDGTYRRLAPDGQEERWAQRELLERRQRP
jgi:polyphosphate kinase